ncbi:hypothetical protein ACO0K7_18020 [Undibacterium sp. Ji67W]|uniref:hypothetical protein n=1 Tax=Undibacterium sp. Ji67W TaxID=3413042 RepID=UPI003BEFB419
MNRIVFLKRVAETLDYEGTLEKGQPMESIDGWDSLGILSMIELFSDLGADVDIDAFSKLKTVDDLIALAGKLVDDE